MLHAYVTYTLAPVLRPFLGVEFVQFRLLFWGLESSSTIKTYLKGHQISVIHAFDEMLGKADP